MLHYGLIKRLSNISISLTSGIRVSDSMRYGGVTQAWARVLGVGTKVQGMSMDKDLWSKFKGSWHGYKQESLE
jgi:hypothetical protein